MSSNRKLKAQVSVDVQAEDSQRLLALLQCSECRDLADDAVETLCCHVLFCADCLKKRHHRCPQCKAACSQTPNHLARRMVGIQEWRCPSCGKETTRSERADHNQVCPQQERRCPAVDCGFRGLPDAFLDHLIVKHKSQLIDQAERLFKPSPRVRYKGIRRLLFDDDDDDDDSDDSLSLQGSDWLEHVVAIQHGGARGYPGPDASMTHMHNTGKNYCCGRLNGPACDCCDGNCGPDNGCNCVNCMRLDLGTFNVATPRTLVNREGVIARISPETGQFYCGRPVMSHDRATDGSCGPNNGHNCHACSRLDSQLLTRYAEIAAEWDDLDTGLQQPRDVRDMVRGRMMRRRRRPRSPLAGSSAHDTVDY